MPNESYTDMFEIESGLADALLYSWIWYLDVRSVLALQREIYFVAELRRQEVVDRDSIGSLLLSHD
jgi:hypothetical protein